MRNPSGHPPSDVGTDREPVVGATIAGFRIEALIGRGGMGTVYRAEEAEHAREVALKVIAPELAQDERFRERFLRESQIAASLDHPLYQAACGVALRPILRGVVPVDPPDHLTRNSEDRWLER